MSVAAGIAQPRRAVAAGDERDEDQRPAATTPPTAASAGSAAARAVAQLAVDELALDLEPDDEEEQRHQPVVDPVVQVESGRARARAQNAS